MSFSCEIAKGRSRVGSRTGAHCRRLVNLFIGQHSSLCDFAVRDMLPKQLSSAGRSR